MNIDQIDGRPFNIKETLESYKIQQMNNLRNMQRHAYNKISGKEPFGDNTIQQEENDDTCFDVDVDDDDSNVNEIVLTLEDSDVSGEEELTKPIEFDHNKFNNNFLNPNNHFQNNINSIYGHTR